MRCPGCGAAVGEGAEICFECGEPIPSRPRAAGAGTGTGAATGTGAVTGTGTVTGTGAATGTRAATASAAGVRKAARAAGRRHEDPDPIRCRGCGTPNAPTAPRCRGCGTPIRPPAP